MPSGEAGERSWRIRATRLSSDSSSTKRSASATSRSLNSARARFPATSTCTVASPRGRCKGPWTRRMLWVFSSGTQVVARLILPVTHTACAPSWPAERKWKLSGALSLARRGGGVRSGSGAPRRRASRCQESCCEPTGSRAFRTTRGAFAALVARRRPRDVDLEPAPPEGPPQERFDLAHGLDPPVGDGLGDRLEEPASDADALGPLHRDERVLAREPPPDHAGEAEQVDGQEAGHGRAAVRGSNWSRTASAATVPIKMMLMSDSRTEPSRRPVVTIAIGSPVLAEAATSGSWCPASSTQSELGCLGLGEVGELAVGRSRSGDADPQLRHAEDAGEEGADDVDRLDAGQREAARVLPDESGLYPQGVALEAPAGDHPVHVAVHGGGQT